jgi:LacI family transcriptional regulator
MPIVLVGSLHKDIRRSHRIVPDDQAIGRMAAAHLLERGIRHFAFVGYDRMYWSRLRQESFSQALAAAGRTCTVFKQTQDLRLRIWRREQMVLAEWLKTLSRPVGLMACNDDRARQVVDACATAGLCIPEEAAVLGVDNDELVCNLSNPPISSISLGLEDAGYRAAMLLDELMAASKGRQIRSPAQILVSPIAVVARQSTDVTAIEDPCVMQALLFIRENSRRPLQIDDVVHRTAISRRSLFDKFRRAVGCTVHQYIKRTRMARIEELLLGTSHSVGEIAEMLGFAGLDHITLFFRSVKGMTPQMFRTRHAPRR